MISQRLNKHGKSGTRPMKKSLFTRVYKALKAIWILICNPWKLNLILDHNEEWEAVVKKKHKLTSLPVIPFRYFVPDTVTVEPYAFLDGGAMPSDLALLKKLAAGIQDCRYFEIGTWRGESAANVAASAKVCYTLNLSGSDLEKTSDNPGYLASQGFFSMNVANIKHLYGNSLTFDFASLAMKFDLIFIDGDHHYDTIVNDTQKVLQYLCHENSVIVWHDYGYNPEFLRYETMAAILDACPERLHPHLFHVENTHCAILFREKVSSVEFKKHAPPDHFFSVQLKVRPVI